MINIKITDVLLYKISGEYTDPGFPSGNRQVNQLDLYQELNKNTVHKSKKNFRVNDLFVEIETDQGLSGIYGAIDSNQAFIIYNNLKSFLKGRDPLAIEKLYDQMIRLHRHGRSGLFMNAVSAIDLALWDLKGKFMEQPVYRLLGGPVREEIPAYASMLGYSTEPEKAAEIALQFKEKGYQAQKWFFTYGPADRAEGIRKNLALASAVREAVGEHYYLMFDAFMGWNVDFTIKMLKGLKKVNPTWIEEPLPPEKIRGFDKIKNETCLPLATGEHVFTRWQVNELLVNKVVDYIQTDPDWTGGITELLKICSLASSFNIPVVAHGHSLLPALHVAAAQSPETVPWVEYLIRHQERKQFFNKTIHRPVQGMLKLPDSPGLGIILDKEKIAEKEEIRFSI